MKAAARTVQDLEFRQLIERIKLALPIEEVVAVRVPALKRAGSILKACCPFHDEKHPSFTVTPSRGTWRCFGACAEGGDAISFVEKFDGVPFWEAVQELAQSAGIELPKRGAKSSDDPRLAAMNEGLERAQALYARKLKSAEGAPARAYLAERGLSDLAIDSFGLGWAPTGNVLVQGATSAGFKLDGLVDAGLARRRDDGSAYDFFRSRLMIPIRDHLGRMAGFGARLLPGVEGPKYVNTPETPLFKKGRMFYGLDAALESVRSERHLLLMEGYTDVIAAHACGLPIAAAVLGTATTEDHARLVRRTGARRVTLVFDADNAGRKAVTKALTGLLTLDAVEIDVVSLPEGQDPCDFLIANGAPAFRELLAAAVGWFDFLVEGLIGLEPEAVAAGVAELLEVLCGLESAVDRDLRLGRLAERLGLSTEALRSDFSAIVAARKRYASRARPATRSGAGETAAPRSGASESAGAGHARTPGRGPQGTAGEPWPEPLPGDGEENLDASPEALAGGSASGAAVVRSGATMASRQREFQQFKRELKVVGQLLGALLWDNSLIPVHRDLLVTLVASGTPADDAARGAREGSERVWVEVPKALIELIEELIRTYDNTDDEITAVGLAAALGDHEARPMVFKAEGLAELATDKAELARDAARFLDGSALARSKRLRLETLERIAVENPSEENQNRLLRTAQELHPLHELAKAEAHELAKAEAHELPEASELQPGERS